MSKSIFSVQQQRTMPQYVEVEEEISIASGSIFEDIVLRSALPLSWSWQWTSLACGSTFFFFFGLYEDARSHPNYQTGCQAAVLSAPGFSGNIVVQDSSELVAGSSLNKLMLFKWSWTKVFGSVWIHETREFKVMLYHHLFLFDMSAGFNVFICLFIFFTIWVKFSFYYTD